MFHFDIDYFLLVKRTKMKPGHSTFQVIETLKTNKFSKDSRNMTTLNFHVGLGTPKIYNIG